GLAPRLPSTFANFSYSPNLNQLHRSILVLLHHVPSRLFQKLHGDEAEYGAGSDHHEEAAGIDERQHRQEHHAAHVAVSTGHAGDLAGHAPLDQRHHGEHRAAAGLHEQRTSYGHDHRQRQRPGAIDLAHGQV